MYGVNGVLSCNVFTAELFFFTPTTLRGSSLPSTACRKVVRPIPKVHYTFAMDFVCFLHLGNTTYMQQYGAAHNILQKLPMYFAAAQSTKRAFVSILIESQHPQSRDGTKRAGTGCEEKIRGSKTVPYLTPRWVCTFRDAYPRTPAAGDNGGTNNLPNTGVRVLLLWPTRSEGRRDAG